MKAVKIFLAVAIIVSAGVFFLVHDKDNKVDAVHPVIGPAVQAVYATGTVEPSVMFPVAPRSASRLVALFVDEGQKVSAGEILAQLEDQDVQKSLEAARVEEVLARKEYDRKANLLRQKAMPKNELDQAEAALATATARVAEVEATLAYMKLTAPNGGTVIRRDGEVGALIATNQAVFWLAAADSGLRVSTEVDEEDIPFVKSGQKALIRADAFPGKVFEGKVLSITPKGDPVSRSYRVRISLDAQSPLMIGMTAEANIVVREEQAAMLLPSTALRGDSVWIFAGDTLERRRVTVGARTPATVEIREGVALQDIVVMDAGDDMSQEKQAVANLKDWQATPE